MFTTGAGRASWRFPFVIVYSLEKINTRNQNYTCCRIKENTQNDTITVTLKKGWQSLKQNNVLPLEFLTDE